MVMPAMIGQLPLGTLDCLKEFDRNATLCPFSSYRTGLLYWLTTILPRPPR